jgi:hypothetical protein
LRGAAEDADRMPSLPLRFGIELVVDKAADRADAALPWFDYYGGDARVLDRAAKLK